MAVHSSVSPVARPEKCSTEFEHEKFLLWVSSLLLFPLENDFSIPH